MIEILQLVDRFDLELMIGREQLGGLPSTAAGGSVDVIDRRRGPRKTPARPEDGRVEPMIGWLSSMGGKAIGGLTATTAGYPGRGGISRTVHNGRRLHPAAAKRRSNAAFIVHSGPTHFTLQSLNRQHRVAWRE